MSYHFQYVVFKVHVLCDGFKKLNPICITRIELVLCIPLWIMHPLCKTPLRLFFYKSGIHLLSRAVSSKVPSAASVLTIVFGMRTGVSHWRIDTAYILLY